MRRNTQKTEVTWNADVSEEMLHELDRLLPISGTRTWAVRTGLEEFLKLMETTPLAVEAAHADIQRALYAEETPKGLRALNVKIPTHQYDRFNELFPEWGATTWFMRRFINQFIAELQGENWDLNEIVRRSVRNAMTSHT